MDRLNKRRALKLRFRRKLRLQRRQVEEFGAQAEQRLEDDFFKRLERLGAVRRFVGSWLLLLVLLIGVMIVQTRGLSKYYQDFVPVPGGTYTEGILGSFNNANPLYATDVVDSSVSKLLFAGLLTYDQTNHLVGDLADTWHANESGTQYTVHLRPHLTWHDGAALTAEDVLFTYQIVQSPDARSPLYNSWQGITVAAPDARTITFTLPNPLASFPYYLTNGIVPKHILGSVPMAEMRSQAFNTVKPVGAGPFQWQAIELVGGSVDSREEHIALKPFAGYHADKPQLNTFVIRTFRGQDQLINSFQKQELNAVVGLLNIPDQLKNDKNMRVYNLPLTAQVMVFFKTSQGVLNEGAVRKALVQGTNITAVMDGLDYPTTPVTEPLMRNQLGYNGAYRQAGYDPAAAAATLDGAGWRKGKNGIRERNGAPLSFVLTAQRNGEYGRVSHELAQQWRQLGVDVKVDAQDDVTTFQKALTGHAYDAVIYGISVGVDPDVYAYWHSSQADLRSPVRLNFAEYHSARADATLEDARTRLDPALRAAKYQPFLQAWQGDVPALGLYQPRFLYLTHGTVHGLDEHLINTDADRFNNVQNWQIREARQTPPRQ